MQKRGPSSTSPGAAGRGQGRPEPRHVHGSPPKIGGSLEEAIRHDFRERKSPRRCAAGVDVFAGKAAAWRRGKNHCAAAWSLPPGC